MRGAITIKHFYDVVGPVANRSVPLGPVANRSVPPGGFYAEVELRVSDITNETPEPIISEIDELQEEKSIILGFNKKLQLPYAISIINQWMSIVTIPIDALTFPRQGLRKLQFNVVIKDTTASATKIVNYNNKSIGYLDENDNRAVFEQKAVELAFAVSVADSVAHQNEAIVIKNWIKRRIRVAADYEKNETKTRMNDAVTRAYQIFIDGESHDIYEICEELMSVATTAERYEVLELCLQVAKADGVAEQEELDIIDKLAELLEIDKDRYRLMRDKVLPITMMNDADVVDIDKLLGITSDMDIHEQEKHLIKEFKKWNSQVEHKSAEIRKQAEEMLEKIARKKEELRKQAKA